ncbi:MAG: hypothetical protein LBT10_05230 [Methanobrevibacter sp.]|jgi:hypothetical protein|nr:hypothetical protein [Methanobrevibacter sp.]
MKIKGLIIIALILTSIISSNFAFNEQSTINSTSKYGGGVLASTIDIQAISSETGAVGDVRDANPCNNPVAIYNFTDANNVKLLNWLNTNLEKKAENDSTLADIELIGFKFTPINSDYFNVTVDEDNIVKVTQLQDVRDNEQVLFLSSVALIRNKTTGNVINVKFVNYLADKNPNVPNADKRLVNPPISSRLSSDFCNYACTIAASFCAGAMGEVELCALLGIGGLVCIAFIAIACATVGLGCRGACEGIPGPF